MMKAERKYAVYCWKILRAAKLIDNRSKRVPAKSVSLLGNIANNIIKNLVEVSAADERRPISDEQMAEAIVDMQIQLEEHYEKAKREIDERMDLENSD